jgi:hypothetical protein
MPQLPSEQRVHVIAAVRDTGKPPLARYARVIITIQP